MKATAHVILLDDSDELVLVETPHGRFWAETKEVEYEDGQTVEVSYDPQDQYANIVIPLSHREA